MSSCNSIPKLDFPCTFIGDTVGSRTIGIANISKPLKRATCVFTRYGSSVPDLTLDSVDGGITISDNTANAWSIVIGPITKEQTALLDAATYYYRLQVIIDDDEDDADDDVDDSARTLLEGTLKIK